MSVKIKTFFYFFDDSIQHGKHLPRNKKGPPPFVLFLSRRAFKKKPVMFLFFAWAKEMNLLSHPPPFSDIKIEREREREKLLFVVRTFTFARA